MKNLVIYYSYTGNTEVIAKEINDLVGGDIQRIEEKKPRKQGGMMGAALSALLSMRSSLKPIKISLADYDNIFLGAQVWAGHTTPPINAFLNKADLKNKSVYLFMTRADDKEPVKVIESVTTRVEKCGGTVKGSFSLMTRMGSVITHDEVKAPVAGWVEKAVNL